MPIKMRKVSLLGAFEIQAESDAPIRDGLILGSRREQMGFVLETSRENVEQIVAIATPPRPGLPVRMAGAIGPLLEELGCEPVRIELLPLPLPVDMQEEGYGSYVQGWLVFRNGARRLQRLAMTATESIQVGIATGLPMLAAYDLLRLNVSQFLEEIDEFSQNRQVESKRFRAFVHNVTATDFQRFYEARVSQDGEPDGEPDGEDEA